MFWGKTFQTKHEFVIALCDENLLEKEIGLKNFKIKINRHFYGGQLINKDLALKLMKKATIGNLFGKEIIDFAEKNGFITKENIIIFDDVPHAQFVKI